MNAIVKKYSVFWSGKPVVRYIVKITKIESQISTNTVTLEIISKF